MSTQRPLAIADVFKFYNDVVKPVYSHIEAIQNALPIELLFEIHSAFDHLKRYYVNEESEHSVAKSAFGHLKRGVLDAYKIDLKVFNEEVEQIQRTYDLEFVDNGKYLLNFNQAKYEIRELATAARVQVQNDNLDDVFEKWSQVSVKIAYFRKEFIGNKLVDLDWSTKKSKRFLTKEKVYSFLIGVASSLVATAIVS